MAHTLPALPYDFDALEPSIDATTMQIHHDKHHQAYVDNLNKALAGTAGESMSIDELMKNIEQFPAGVRNNGGGHYNHSLFWTVLGPAKDANGPSGALKAAIDECCGGMDSLKEKMSTAGATRFGSGWAWLIVDANGKLAVTSTPNQDNPLMPVAEMQGMPIFGIDVWEHAYYLKYQNKRPDYLAAIWNVVNWDEVARRYESAGGK